jgi:uncharacterized protein YjiS (DUF1127 family)
VELKMNAIVERAANSRAPSSADAVWAALIVRRCWEAAVNWRLENAAFAELSAMSTRQLRDIGFARSEIGPAVRGEVQRVEPSQS